MVYSHCIGQPSIKMQSEIKNFYCTFINVHYIICDCGDAFPTEEELKEHLQTKHDSGNILECINVPPITITGSIEEDVQRNVSNSHEKTGLDVLLDGVDIQCMTENNQPVFKPLKGGKKTKMKPVEVKEQKVEKKKKESVYEIMIRLLGSDFFKPPKRPKRLEVDKKMVTVTELTLKQAVQELKKRKEKIGYKEATYHCQFCHRYYHSIQRFEEHMQSHDESHGPYECAVCKIRMKSKWNLSKHVEGLHKRKYSCKICPFTSTHKDSIIRHTAFHKGLKHKCSHCSKEFANVLTYEQHLRRNHPARHACAHCGYTFVSEHGLNMHASKMHRSDGEVPLFGPFCDVCEKQFVSEEAFDRHLEMSSLHNSESTLKRPNAPKNINTIARNAEMKKRYDRPYPCEECGLELTKRNYIKHFRSAHPGKQIKRFHLKPAQCNLCGKMFNNKPNLYTHMQTHGEPRYTCECGKKFHVLFNYKKHRATHLPRELRTTHACHLCDTTFTLKQNLQRHLAVTHPGLKPFPCDVCGKSYTAKSVLQGHINHVHLKIPRPPREPRRPRGPRHEIGAPAREILETGGPDYAITSIDHDMQGRNYEIRTSNHEMRSPEYEIRATNDGTRGPDYEIRGTDHEIRDSNRTEMRRSNQEIRFPGNKIIGLSRKEMRGQDCEVRVTDHEMRSRAHEKRGPDSKKRGLDQGHRPRVRKRSSDQEIQGLLVKTSNSNNKNGGPDHEIQGLLVRSSNFNNKKGGLDQEIQGLLVKSLNSNNINRGLDHEVRASNHRGPYKDKGLQRVVKNSYDTSLRPHHIQMRDSGHIDMREYDHIDKLD
ncbi:zinc finger protein 546-like [Aricia agestis]|uniref:zinc finger protein 546-like n=1 Tax=Aricia agestis TaxID=91739 RepID=UPI001C20264D|nr:zinc finger protein 546-like [Aricia agestis]